MESRLFGALINVGRSDDDRFDCLKIARSDFRPTKDWVRANSDFFASAYLDSTIDHIQAVTDIKLHVLSIGGDGSCLPNSVSKSIAGSEM